VLFRSTRASVWIEHPVLQGVAGCCRVLWDVAVCCSVLQSAQTSVSIKRTISVVGFGEN